MARILQQDMFGWKSVGYMPELERFRMVRDTLDDEAVVGALEVLRGRGRNDYPVRPMWNAVILFPLTGHTTWSAYCRELGRNRDLMEVCGFPVGCKAPKECVFNRFLTRVKEVQALVGDIIHGAIDVLGELLPDFCEHLGIDSQAFNSSAQKRSDKKRQDGQPDERGEHDAENSKKVCAADGETVEYTWFGFKNHLLCDTKYQLPLFPLVAGGTSSDTKHLRPLLESYAQRHPVLLGRLKELSADMAYDSRENILLVRSLTAGSAGLLCPTRKTWKSPDFKYIDDTGKERMLKLLSTPGNEDICYDEDGQLYCCAEKDGNVWLHSPMVFKGYEKDRQAVKYTCPAAHYGTDCPGKKECEKGYGRCVRVKLAFDPRVFVPTPRHTIKFERGYSRRTAVERINGLFNELFGIKRMKVRGLSNARLRVSLMVMTVLTMAVARIHDGQKEKMTSIVAAA